MHEVLHIYSVGLLSLNLLNPIYRILVIFFNSKWVWHEHRETYVTNSSALGLSRYGELNKIFFSNTLVWFGFYYFSSLPQQYKVQISRGTTKRENKTEQRGRCN